MWDTVISESIYLSSNTIPESRDSVLSSIRIYGKKYRIQSSKTDTATNVNNHKMTEIIESNTILGVIDDKGVTLLLINSRVIVIVLDPVSSF